MNNKLRGKSMDSLFQAILHLNTLEECSNFFEDLCTISELRAMEQRFQVAAMLDEGRIYSDIAKDVIRPSAKECASNPRARSTKFRWAVRSDVQKYE